MFRIIGITLMGLAYGKEQLGDIIILFVLPNLLMFSLGLIILSRDASNWLWLRNPNIWDAVIGVALAPFSSYIPEFVMITVGLVNQIVTVPATVWATLTWL